MFRTTFITGRRAVAVRHGSRVCGSPARHQHRNDVACTNVGIKEMRKLIESKFDSIGKRFDNLENRIKWIIGFGVGAAGLSIGTMILQALYYDRGFKDEILLVTREAVGNSASKMGGRILLAVKNDL
ncbi:hypothetical protein HOY80DRAFT_1056043 [Tuber brumale]|nr:hypothetical protein HOY80DRAFT_1056043 [Tuber brumale]